ncbi:MAG: GGDEF domain-containing protein [Clostridia bacterium]|nr:GGDEF domain-containing protein [Clostridia bacterium]
MSTNGKRRTKKTFFQADILDYQTFLAENQKNVNLLLNRYLRISIITGPLLMLAVRLGIFQGISYTMCILLTLLFLLLCCIHYALIRREGNAVLAAVIAFLALDSLLLMMNSAHIEIHITWFSVPLLSLLFCDFNIFSIAVVINYIVMSVSLWLVAPYYANLWQNINSAIQYFSIKMGSYTIETFIMVVAGYSLCKLSISHYRELIEKYRILSENKRQLNEQMAILKSMSEIYEYASLIDLDQRMETLIRSAEAGEQHISQQIGHQSNMNIKLMQSVSEEHRNAFQAFADLETAAAALHGQKSIDREFRTAESGWFRAQYIVVERRADSTPKSVIYTVQSIDKQKQKEEQLIRISMTDELTGLFNRRCYDADIELYKEKKIHQDFVIFSVDVNGLKKVNDTMGHAAGDELLIAAAQCLSAAIGPIGKVYRTGGDEFLGIADTPAPADIAAQINQLAAAWHGPHVDSMSLSVGYASHSQHPDADFHELEVIADQMMYREKNNYYRMPGADRRRKTAEQA